MSSLLLLVIFIVFLALIFDFLNGFHDAANSIATIVSTRVLKPHYAVMWAAFFNFIAILIFETKVAATVGKGLVDPTIIDPVFILSALSGAIVWNLITWYYGIPSSSSHALIGGLLGVALIKMGGFTAIQIMGVSKTLIAIIISPLTGFVLGVILMFCTIHIFFHVRRQKIDVVFRKLQLVSSALISIGHGANDAQKTMGIITVLLYSSGHLSGEFHVPPLVAFACYFVIALGTLFGGWRIVRTMGSKITKLKPVNGFCAETGAALTLFTATAMGIPVSSTHTITGAIVGVGSAQKSSAIRWTLARRIVWAWVITLPCAALVSGSVWWIINLFL
ncbi:MAG: inorganic phosphate transporter [Gammaproteobacteria bacterium]